MTHHSYQLLGPNPNLSDGIRDEHDGLVALPAPAMISAVARMLRQSRYVPFARIVGEPGSRPTDLLGYSKPHLAVDTRTGEAWVTTPGGGIAAGCLFELLGLTDLAQARGAWTARIRCHAPLSRDHASLLVEIAEDCLEERAWCEEGILKMTASRYEMIEILILLVRHLGEQARAGTVIRFHEAVDTISVADPVSDEG